VKVTTDPTIQGVKEVKSNIEKSSLTTLRSMSLDFFVSLTIKSKFIEKFKIRVIFTPLVVNSTFFFTICAEEKRD